VDLIGRLSNPPDPLETLAGQGIAGSTETGEKASKRAKSAPGPSASTDRKETGRLSNPSIEWTGMRTAAQDSTATEQPNPSRAQKRLHGEQVDELVAAYRAGDSADELAERFGVHRTTAMAHLRRRQVELRAGFTAWDHNALTAAAALYASGASLAAVATGFGVDASTVANRFRRAGVAVRPRRGWG
jgi:hypothetical protein